VVLRVTEEDQAAGNPAAQRSRREQVVAQGRPDRHHRLDSRRQQQVKSLTLLNSLCMRHLHVLQARSPLVKYQPHLAFKNTGKLQDRF